MLVVCIMWDFSMPKNANKNLRARSKGRKLAWQCDGHETQKVAQRRSILGSPGERGRERVVK